MKMLWQKVKCVFGFHAYAEIESWYTDPYVAANSECLYCGKLEH